MSGPKLIELRRLRRAAQRKYNLERFAELSSRYIRLFKQATDLARSLQALGVAVPEPAQTPGALERAFRPLLEAQKDVEVVREFQSTVELFATYVADLQLKCRARLAEIENRKQQFEREREQLMAWQAQLAETSELAPRISNLEAPAALETGAGLTALESAERSLADWRQALSRLRESSAALSADSPVVAASQASVLPSSVEEYLSKKRRTGNESSLAPANGDLRAQAEKLVAEAAAEQLSRAPDLAEALREVLRVGVPEQQRLLLEALVIESASELQKAKALAVWREQIVNSLIDSAAAFSSPRVRWAVEALEQEARSSVVREIGPLRQELEAAIAVEKQSQEREEKRRALLDSLLELGYETNEQLQTALVEGGRVVFSHPRQAEYAVELVANKDMSHLQTALVRFGADDAMSEEQRRRDIEHEELWCADHGRLSEKLAERGFEVSLKAQKQPGQHPVKVLHDPALQRKPAARPKERENR